jgi:hypothetical protein
MCNDVGVERDAMPDRDQIKASNSSFATSEVTRNYRHLPVASLLCCWSRCADSIEAGRKMNHQSQCAHPVWTVLPPG